MENTNNIVDAQTIRQRIPIKQALLRTLHISVEPIFFTLFLAFSLTDAASTNIILKRTCTMIYNFSKENCTGEIPSNVNHKIQPYTARIIMAKSIIQAIFPSIMSLFIGSWSDNSKKRKPFLILPIIGLIMDYTVWIIFILLPVPPIYFLLTVLPGSLTGGFVGVFTCGYSYISDITNDQNRAFRMSVCTIFLTLGILSGYLLSTEIFETFHKNVYLILFGIALCCMILILLYAIFLLPEPVIFLQDDSLTSTSTRSSFFNLTHVRESINVLLKRRPSHGRPVLLLLIAIIVLDILIFQGESSFRYLSLKAGFFWTAEDYNIFSAVLSGTAVIIGITGLWLLNNILGLSETFIILLIVTISFISTILISISKSTLDVYCAALFGCLVVLLSPLVKSEMSSMVPNSDIGKVFAFTSTLEAVTPFAASPAYAEVYNSVVSYKPLYFFFLSAAIWLLAIILAVIIIIMHNLYGHEYKHLEEQLTNENETRSLLTSTSD